MPRDVCLRLLVSGLQVSETGVSGTVPASLSRLTALSTLQLSGNAGINGTIPDMFAGMTNLTYAAFHCSVCSFLRAMKWPVFVSDHGNKYFVPMGVSCVVLLFLLSCWCCYHRSLRLYLNSFTGTLPQSLSVLVNLQYVRREYRNGVETVIDCKGGGRYPKTVVE